MKIKFKGKTLNIQNKDSGSLIKNFYTNWNYFSIYVAKNNKSYGSTVTSPLGDMLVDCDSYKTMTEAVQDAFKNIELDIDEKRNMLAGQDQLLQDEDITEEGLEEIEYWYGDIIKKYY